MVHKEGIARFPHFCRLSLLQIKLGSANLHLEEQGYKTDQLTLYERGVV
jgi:hypothetical protein